jgi:hypothetical protein
MVPGTRTIQVFRKILNLISSSLSFGAGRQRRQSVNIEFLDSLQCCALGEVVLAATNVPFRFAKKTSSWSFLTCCKPGDTCHILEIMSVGMFAVGYFHRLLFYRIFQPSPINRNILWRSEFWLTDGICQLNRYQTVSLLICKCSS